MRSKAALPPDPRRRALALVVCVWLLPLAVPRLHFGHAAGAAETPIFRDARHAGQAEHCEAAETVRIRHCPACLAPTRTQGLGPARAALEHRLQPAPAASGRSIPPPGRDTTRPIRPRAPPRS